MQFDMNTAQQLLTDANKSFASMLPASEVKPSHHNEVSGHAQAYVAAVQGLQQQLVAFAAPAASSTKAALEQQVSALQDELSRADTLLQEANALVQQWQMQCQDMRSKHEAVMTKGIGAQATPLAAQATEQDAGMADAAAEPDQ